MHGVMRAASAVRYRGAGFAFWAWAIALRGSADRSPPFTVLCCDNLPANGQTVARVVARYADACNLYPTPDLSAKLDVLRRHCAEEGRDYDAIEKTCMVHFAIGDGDARTRELIDELHRLAGLGIQTVIGILSRVDPIASLETISREVIPAVAEA